MEDTIKVGSVGSFVLEFSGGKASITGTGAVDGGALNLGLTITADASVFLDQLEAALAKAIPSTAAVDPAIFAVLKAAVASIQ